MAISKAFQAFKAQSNTEDPCTLLMDFYKDVHAVDAIYLTKSTLKYSFSFGPNGNIVRIQLPKWAQEYAEKEGIWKEEDHDLGTCIWCGIRLQDCRCDI